MGIPIVTATDQRYLPGAIALFNSYKRNSPDGFDFYVLAYGDDKLRDDLESRGISVIMNRRFSVDLPRSPKFKHHRQDIEASAMYSRLMVPDIFPDDPIAVYVDADAVILKPLSDLTSINYGDYPCAANLTTGTVAKEIQGWANAGTRRGILTSFMIFNSKAWHEKNIFGKCIDVMGSGMQFNTVVEGVATVALDDDFYKLPEHCQVQGGHATTPDRIHAAHILHFIGTNPWEEFASHLQPPPAHKIFSRNVWSAYA